MKFPGHQDTDQLDGEGHMSSLEADHQIDMLILQMWISSGSTVVDQGSRNLVGGVNDIS
jgi:hypothetical protein